MVVPALRYAHMLAHRDLTECEHMGSCQDGQMSHVYKHVYTQGVRQHDLKFHKIVTGRRGSHQNGWSHTAYSTKVQEVDLQARDQAEQ